MGRPIYNKDNSDKIKTIGHLSLLNGDFSQIYDKFLHDSLSAFTDKILSKFVLAHRNSYSSNHVFSIKFNLHYTNKHWTYNIKIKKHIKTYITHTLNFMNYFKGHKVVKITTTTKQIKKPT